MLFEISSRGCAVLPYVSPEPIEALFALLLNQVPSPPSITTNADFDELERRAEYCKCFKEKSRLDL
jgi:hypothetical protein